MYKICHLSSHHSPRSIRIFKKQCSSLANEGYNVFYVVGGTGSELVNGVNIRYFKKCKGIVGRLLINPLRTYKIAKKIDANIYHFHDPELIVIAYLLKIKRKKVIYDVHENNPAKCYDIIFNKLYFIGKLIVWLIARIEIIFARKFDHNIVVNEEISRRFPIEKTTIITNYPIITLIESSGIGNKYNKKLNGRPVIIYIGMLSRIRGIKEIVRAMSYVKNKANLILLGPWHNALFKDECMNTPGWEYCEYKGVMKLEDVYKTLCESHIGLTILYPQGNYLNSMPTKSLEYMATGLPIIMSDFPLWRDLFSECALFVDPKNPKQIAQKILQLVENPILRKKKGDTGRRIVKEKYSWESESKKLIDIYRKLEKS